MSTTEPQTTAYRLISEYGTHFGTVYSEEAAKRDQASYAKRYGCRVDIVPVEIDHDPRW